MISLNLFKAFSTSFSWYGLASVPSLPDKTIFPDNNGCDHLVWLPFPLLSLNPALRNIFFNSLIFLNAYQWMGVFKGIMIFGKNCSIAIYDCISLHLCNIISSRVELDWVLGIGYWVLGIRQLSIQFCAKNAKYFSVLL